MQTSILRMAVGLGGALLLGASWAAAQPFGPPEGGPVAPEGWHGRGPLGGAVRFLDLTDDQEATAREIVEQQRPEMEALHEAVRKNQAALREALEADHPDPLAVGELAIEGHALRQEARSRREEARRALEAILNPEQKQKLEALEAIRDAGGPRGMGARRGGGLGSFPRERGEK